jgi:imidazolonepropionase-like amidohydrolase
LSKDLGTIERGKIADLILLREDPLANIGNIRSLDLVIARGQVIDRGSLPHKTLFGPAS